MILVVRGTRQVLSVEEHANAYSDTHYEWTFCDEAVLVPDGARVCDLMRCQDMSLAVNEALSLYQIAFVTIRITDEQDSFGGAYAHALTAELISAHLTLEAAEAAADILRDASVIADGRDIPAWSLSRLQKGLPDGYPIPRWVSETELSEVRVMRVTLSPAPGVAHEDAPGCG